ncbi:MAG: DUF599 domain-containing protein [Rhizobiaceae bacterium]
MNFLSELHTADLMALGFFIFGWILLEYVIDYSKFSSKSLGGLMADRRQDWMMVMAERDLRIVDTSIMSGLLQGTAFFASASILAIGGCFALLGSTEVVLQVYKDLPVGVSVSRIQWEIKILGLALLFVYTFFKFGWAFRLFNYSGILLGAVPPIQNATADLRREKALKAAAMNAIAGRHFTSGLRGLFLALGYLGWFVGPLMFFICTVFVFLVLIRRQYFSRSRRVLLD